MVDALAPVLVSTGSGASVIVMVAVMEKLVTGSATPEASFTLAAVSSTVDASLDVVTSVVASICAAVD